MSKLNNEPNIYKTELDFSNDEEMSTQERYVYQFFHTQLNDLEVNQIHVHGVKLNKFNDGFVVRALLRHSLQKKLLLESIRLVVKDSQDREVAKKTFEMDLMGPIDSLKARPWKFFFKEEDLLVPFEEITDEMPFELLFEYNVKVRKDFNLHLDENWSNALNEEQVSQLKNIISTLEPIGENEISVVGFNLFEDENSVHVYVLIRNAFSETLTIDNLPVQLFDAENDLVTKLGFPLGQFQIPAYHARPVSLSFSKSVFNKQNPDFSKWSIQLVPQN